MRYRPVLLPVAFVAVVAIYVGLRDNGQAAGFMSVEPDTRPIFAIDPTKPFVIELGRGSGWHGLDTVRIDQTGLAEVRRAGGNGWVATRIQLAPLQLKQLVDHANQLALRGMARSYSDPGIQDGTQWVLWIEQAPGGKAVYFNNAFPVEARVIAGEIDVALELSGISSATWTPVPAAQAIAEDRLLWSRLH